MKSLMIDTTNSIGSVALFEEKEMLGQTMLNTSLKHLDSLHYAIDNILSAFKVDIRDIGLIGVDVGPGSFTGIRIGVTVARTLAQIGNMYIQGVTSLELLAAKVSFGEFIIVPIIDGKKGRVYTSMFERKKRGVVALEKFYDVTPEQLVGIINEKFSARDIIFVGTGQMLYEDYLRNNLKKIRFTDKNFYYAEAKEIINFIDKSSLSKDYNAVTPFYLRESDAELGCKN